VSAPPSPAALPADSPDTTGLASNEKLMNRAFHRSAVRCSGWLGSVFGPRALRGPKTDPSHPRETGTRQGETLSFCAGARTGSSARPALRPAPGLDIVTGRVPRAARGGRPAPEVRRVMADIVLINPRFEVSCWALEHALPLLGRRANLPVACLPLLAALTPPGHTVTLVDENVEPIDYDRCARADVVGLTGMVVQRARMTEIL